MLHWSTKPTCNNTKLCSRIPVSLSKRSDALRRKATKDKHNLSFGNEDSDFGKMTSKLQRDIGVDVFDWLNECNQHSDKYTLYCNEESSSELSDSLSPVESVKYDKTVLTNKEEKRRIEEEKEIDDIMDRSSEKTGTKSYFNALKNAFFPFEGKYFYLSGEKSNQTVCVKETTRVEVQNTNDCVGVATGKPSNDDERYKEILGDVKKPHESKATNQKWFIQGLKDVTVYDEDERENKNNHVRYNYEYNKLPIKINIKCNNCPESHKEVEKLRMQIEQLSAFVESSEERHEQLEALHAKQKEELLQHIREKEVLENRVCCLEEVRRNLQQKVEETHEENKVLKLSLKSSEDKLNEEKERAKVLRVECSAEIAKNVELELVLQTIREELGCTSVSEQNCHRQRNVITKDLNEKSKDNGPTPRYEKKVRWGNVETQEIRKITHATDLNTDEKRSLKRNEREEEQRTAKTQSSCLKQHGSDENQWKHEKQQFEGKIMLLEMDKTKMRSHIELLEAKIIKQENIAQNLRENNEVLEFRILELEYELVEKGRK